jgi:acyl-CoA hydrolase
MDTNHVLEGGKALSKEKYISAAEAVQSVKTGDRVFIHGSAATPVCLVKALQARHREIHHVELVSITTMGDLDFNNPEWRESFLLFL